MEIELNEISHNCKKYSNNIQYFNNALFKDCAYKHLDFFLQTQGNFAQSVNCETLTFRSIYCQLPDPLWQCALPSQHMEAFGPAASVQTVLSVLEQLELHYSEALLILASLCIRGASRSSRPGKWEILDL